MKNQADAELVQNLVKNFSKLERRQRHFVNNAFKSSGFKGTMYKYVITIKRHPGTSQDFLAEFHSVDKSRVTRVVRELERMGHLSRVANESDRRCYRLFLTARGQRLFNTIQKVLMKWGTVITENISAANISVTVDTIEKMIANAG